MIEFRIDRRSGVSTYMQIVHQVEQAMRLGLLSPGDRLPSAREVVEATTVNPNTVVKAYRELEREGLVQGRRGLGTFVIKSLSSEATTGDDAPLRRELTAWMRGAVESGLVVEDVDALYTAVREELYPSEERS